MTAKQSVDIDAIDCDGPYDAGSHGPGSGSLWICSFKPDVLREEFSLPENLEVINILAWAYAACPPADRSAMPRCAYRWMRWFLTKNCRPAYHSDKHKETDEDRFSTGQRNTGKKKQERQNREEKNREEKTGKAAVKIHGCFYAAILQDLIPDKRVSFPVKL